MATPSPTTVRWWGLGLAMLLGAVIIGCGDARTRYQVLSFFFDGVPDPNALKLSTTRRTGSRGSVIYVHQPFAEAQNDEDKCNTCHLNTNDIFARAQVRRDICLDCHAQVKQQYRITHGPVANDLCTFCHSPHQSVNEHLLKSAAPGICTQCHFPETLSSTPPEHLDPKASCITCHSGHGGYDRTFLKPLPAAPTTIPATAPAAQSAEAEQEVRQ